MENIFIPQRLLDLTLEHLLAEEKERQKIKPDIQQSLDKALSDCQKKLTNLNQMRLRELISDEEYLEEKKSLVREKANLEISIASNPRKRSLEQTIKAFNFAATAKASFRTGTNAEKRSIFQELGSNLFLKDKLLDIQLEKPLQLIENALRGADGKKEWFEPQKIGNFKDIPNLLSPQFLSWWTTVEDVRTFYENSNLSDS